MSFFAKAKHVSDWHARRLPGRAARHLHRPGQQLPRPVAADQPHHGAVRRCDDSDETFGAAVASIKALFPLYPQTKGVDSWDLQRAIAFALTVVDDVARPAAGRPARRARPARPDDGVPARPRARLVGRGQDRPAPLPVRRGAGRPSWCWPGAGRTLAELGGQARTGGGGLLAAFDERLPFTLTRGQEEVSAEIDGRPRASPPDEPAAPGRGRLRQDARRAPRDAPGRRLRRSGRAAWRRPRCSPSSTSGRSPRCSATSPPAACSAAHADATTVVLLTGSMSKAARAEAMLAAASGEAGHRDRHPRPAAGARAVRRPRPRRRRRAAPLRRRAARRAHRQGRHPAPRPGDDRDPDPAHRRDDRVRRPRGLHADRAAGRPRGRSRPTSYRSPTSPHWVDRVWSRVREEVERGHQVYVVCPRIAGDELEQGETDEPDDEDEGADPSSRRSASAPPRRSSRSCGPARSPGCGSVCSTAGWPPTTRTAPCAPSPPGRSTSWCRRP